MNPKLLFSCLVFFFLREKTIPSADNSGLRVIFTTVTKLCPWPHSLVLPAGWDLSPDYFSYLSEQDHAEVNGYSPPNWE